MIPNSDIYTDSVIVKTAVETRQSEYDVGIGCNDGWDVARRIIEKACAGVEDVEQNPAPETIPVKLGDFANVVRLRWWTKTDRATQIHTFGAVMQALCTAPDDEGIDMAYPAQVHLIHDQTEDTEGHRNFDAKDGLLDALSCQNRVTSHQPKKQEQKGVLSNETFARSSKHATLSRRRFHRHCRLDCDAGGERERQHCCTQQ